MNLPDIEQLRKLLKLLRSQGVLQYQTADLNLVLTEKAAAIPRFQVPEIADEEIELTPEEEAERILFYSADKITNSSDAS